MNPSQINSLVGTLVTLLGPFAAKYGVDAGTLTQLGVGAIGAAWLIYSHWNMKKVPVDATVIGPEK